MIYEKFVYLCNTKWFLLFREVGFSEIFLNKSTSGKSIESLSSPKKSQNNSYKIDISCERFGERGIRGMRNEEIKGLQVFEPKTSFAAPDSLRNSPERDFREHLIQ